ncbi:MAG: hypothetical protein DYG84_11190, partial [Candidatus Brocadia sp. AMX3]|nr:hypothetical protein [Candidatus Brocadia sp. AMX3]
FSLWFSFLYQNYFLPYLEGFFFNQVSLFLLYQKIALLGRFLALFKRYFDIFWQFFKKLN